MITVSSERFFANLIFQGKIELKTDSATSFRKKDKLSKV